MAARGEVKNAEALGRMLQQGRLVNGVTQRELAERLDTEVARMLANTQAAPLGNRPKSGRTSLAGVQDKIVLAREDDQWFQVLEGYLSTHIVKPPSARHPTIIFDEEYGFRAANAAGLTRFDAWIEKFGDTRGLVIERYDRSPDSPRGRIHQEDMNQALGASKNEKYQEYGEKVSLTRIAAVLGRDGEPCVSSRSSIMLSQNEQQETFRRSR